MVFLISSKGCYILPPAFTHIVNYRSVRLCIDRAADIVINNNNNNNNNNNSNDSLPCRQNCEQNDVVTVNPSVVSGQHAETEGPAVCQATSAEDIWLKITFLTMTFGPFWPTVTSACNEA